MSDFVMIPRRDYIAELLRIAPRFEASTEYRSLDGDDRTCAGLVFSAFSRFMEESLADQCAIDECQQALEQFASTNDAELHNLVITEVFEGFRRPDILANLLLPRSRALYDRWIGH